MVLSFRLVGRGLAGLLDVIPVVITAAREGGILSSVKGEGCVPAPECLTQNARFRQGGQPCGPRTSKLGSIPARKTRGTMGKSPVRT